ncbi:MAG: hypothetical protein K9H12_02295, partial [Bacteroidales bacterium]|nr:hypothetical protein [Bacteroidales bacterium]
MKIGFLKSALLFFLVINFSCTPKEEKFSLEVIGKIAIKNSSEIEDSYWGIQASTLDSALLVRMSDIGVKWTRLGASWPSIERKKGIYSWDETDKAFRTTLENAIIPFVTLGGGHKLYSPLTTYDDPKLAEIYGYKPAPPTDNEESMEAWLNFVRATIERYKDQISYWEIWNEPNHRNYWGKEPSGKEYGYLVRETAKVILEIQPDAKILAGSMAGIDPVFIRDFLEDGGAEYIDIITYHNYGSIPEERIYAATEAWEVINEIKPEIEFWQGECGYPSHSSSRDYRGISPWGMNIQAKWLLRQAFTDVYFCNARLSNYFKLVHDSGYGEKPKRTNLTSIDSILGYPERKGSRIKTVGVNEKCILSNPDFEPKPAYYSYQNLCSLIDKSYIPLKNSHELTIIDPGVFYGIGEYDDGFPSQTLVAHFVNQYNESLVAYWLPWHPQEDIMKEGRMNLLLKNTNFTDPVLVDLLTGEVMQIAEFEN